MPDMLLALSWDDIERDGPKVLIILAILIVGYIIFRSVFPRVARAAILRGATAPDEEMDKRADTIVHVLERTAGIAFLLIAIVSLLDIIGVDVTTIIAGLGIGGLALALGAQALVRDTINGIFLLAEDQYRTGDVIRIADVTGTVENISLRRTVIRDDDGIVHIVPNGAISVVSNYTRDYAVVNVKVQVAYGEDVSRLNALVERVGKELAADPGHRGSIIEPPQVGSVDSVGDGGVTVTVSARAKASARWDVSAELRRRLMESFLREGIRVPFASISPDTDKPASPAR